MAVRRLQRQREFSVPQEVRRFFSRLWIKKIDLSLKLNPERSEAFLDPAKHFVARDRFLRLDGERRFVDGRARSEKHETREP